MTSMQIQGMEMRTGDDPMETDADRRVFQAEDVDIDLDLTGDNQQEEEDEYMNDDIAAFRHQAAENIDDGNAYNDDEMVDEGYVEAVGADAGSIQDEYLQDAEVANPHEDEDKIIDALDNQTPPLGIEAPQNHDSTIEEFSEESQENHIPLTGHNEFEEPTQDQEISLLYNDQPQEGQNLPTKSEQEPLNDESYNEATLQTKLPESSTDSSEHVDHMAQQPHRTPTLSLIDEVVQIHPRDVDNIPTANAQDVEPRPESTHSPGILQVVGSNEDTSTEQGRQLDLLEPDGLNTGRQADHYEDPSQTSDYVPPVVISYQDSDYALFPPHHEDQEHSEYLLENEELARESILDLLKACRLVLAGDVLEHDELVLEVDELDLRVSEYAGGATSTTLSELIEIYTQLQHFDGVQSPPPFHVRLYTTVQFSHRLDYLRSALDDGKGLSQVKIVGQPDILEASEALNQDEQDQSEQVYVEPSIQEEIITYDQDREEESVRVNLAKSDPTHSDFDPEQEPSQPKPATDVDVQADFADAARTLQAGNRIDGSKSTSTTIEENLRTHDRNDEQQSVAAIEAESGRAAAASKAQPLEGSQHVRTNDEEDIIDYEDEGLVVKSSTDSSTLQGDALEAPDNQALSLSDSRTTLKEEALSPTETSSHTVEEFQANETINYRPQGVLSKADPYMEDNLPDDAGLQGIGEDHADNAIYAGTEEAKDTEVEDDDDDQERSEDLGAPEDAAGQESEDRVELANEDGDHEYFAEYPGLTAGPEEAEDLELKDEGLGDSLEDFSDATDNGTYGQYGYGGDLEAENEPAQEGDTIEGDERDYNQDSELLDEEQASTAVDNVTNLKGERFAIPVTDTLPQSPEKEVIPVEDDDEITYEDDDDDDETEAMPVEQGPPSPGSLKRSRGHDDADDAAADDFQELKRLRPA